MPKGFVLGLLVGLVALIAYAVWNDLEPAPEGPKTVDELRAETKPELLDLARYSPGSALLQAKPENYPVFLAFLDLDLGITQSASDDYRQIFDRVAAFYSNDTRAQIVEAVFRIHEASVYYPTLTYRESLEYIQDTVPPGFKSDGSSTGYGKSIRGVAEEIYGFLYSSYMQPQWDALQEQLEQNDRMQQRINQNLQAARAKGAAANAARDRAIAAHNARVQRNIDSAYNNYQWNAWNSYWNYRR